MTSVSIVIVLLSLVSLPQTSSFSNVILKPLQINPNAQIKLYSSSSEDALVEYTKLKSLLKENDVFKEKQETLKKSPSSSKPNSNSISNSNPSIEKFKKQIIDFKQQASLLTKTNTQLTKANTKVTDDNSKLSEQKQQLTKDLTAGKRRNKLFLQTNLTHPLNPTPPLPTPHSQTYPPIQFQHDREAKGEPRFES